MKELMREIGAVENRIKRIIVLKMASRRKMGPCSSVVLSFPKSGRTWLRTILGKYMELEYGVPFTLELNSEEIDKELKIGFTHFFKRVEEVGDCKKILLLRDPRDVIVSHYHQCKKREKIFNGSISQFINDWEFGISKTIDFMNEAWGRYAGREDCIVVSYENMHENAYRELTRIISFLGFRMDEEKLKEAIAFSEFRNMQKMERNNSFDNFRLKAMNKGDIDTYKVRKGKIGGYREELEKRDIEYINEIIKRDLDEDIKKFLNLEKEV